MMVSTYSDGMLGIMADGRISFRIAPGRAAALADELAQRLKQQKVKRDPVRLQQHHFDVVLSREAAAELVKEIRYHLKSGWGTTRFAAPGPALRLVEAN